MDLEGVTGGVALLALLIGIANTLWVWLSAGGRKLAAGQADLAADQEKLVCDIDKLDSRVQAIESELKHLPSKDDVTALKLGLTTVEGQLNTFQSEMAGVGRAVHRIENHLLVRS